MEDKEELVSVGAWFYLISLFNYKINLKEGFMQIKLKRDQNVDS